MDKNSCATIGKSAPLLPVAQGGWAICTFAIYAEDTSIDDRTGVAMAEALQRNTSLQSFTFNANETSFGEKTGVAMADALERKHEPSQEERREERG